MSNEDDLCQLAGCGHKRRLHNLAIPQTYEAFCVECYDFGIGSVGGPDEHAFVESGGSSDGVHEPGEVGEGSSDRSIAIDDQGAGVAGLHESADGQRRVAVRESIDVQASSTKDEMRWHEPFTCWLMPDGNWTDDVGRARRFPDRAAAEAVIRERSGILPRHRFEGRAVEHIFLGVTQPERGPMCRRICGPEFGEEPSAPRTYHPIVRPTGYPICQQCGWPVEGIDHSFDHAYPPYQPKEAPVSKPITLADIETLREVAEAAVGNESMYHTFHAVVTPEKVVYLLAVEDYLGRSEPDGLAAVLAMVNGEGPKADEPMSGAEFDALLADDQG